MKYCKNPNMDYILADETSMAVFDPDTENTYFFDEIGIDILNILNDPCDLQTLLDSLCQIYDVLPAEIQTDVEEFLADVISKMVVLCQ